MTENKLHIYIRTSLISSLIGKSKYNKLYESFIKILNMNKNNIYHDNNEFDEIYKILNICGLNINEENYNDINSLKNILNNIKILQNNINELNNNKIYENIKNINKPKNKNNLSSLNDQNNDIIAKNIISTFKSINDNNNKLFTLNQTLFIPSINYDLFFEKCKKHIICNYGKIHEIDILNYYKKINNIECCDKKLFKDLLIFSCKYYDLILTGTPDAITTNDEIIEIKNRIHTFSDEIKECDYIQLQIYLNLYNYNNGTLVEGMIYDQNNIQINEFKLKKDIKLFEIIKNKLILISILIYKLLVDENLYNIFINKNNINKNQFIYKNIYKIKDFFNEC